MFYNDKINKYLINPMNMKWKTNLKLIRLVFKVFIVSKQECLISFKNLTTVKII